MRKGFSIAGILVGAYIVLIGILTASGTFGSAGAHGGSAPYSSGYAKFGADYYTYSVNNTAEAASAARAAAGNLCGISELLSLSLGLFFIGFGAADICLFGAFYPKKAKVSEEVPVPAEVSEEAVCEDSSEENTADESASDTIEEV